jgi:hypothetical protein
VRGVVVEWREVDDVKVCCCLKFKDETLYRAL